MIVDAAELERLRPFMTSAERAEVDRLLGEVDVPPPPISFREFVGLANPHYQWYRHCEILERILLRVIAGELTRVMIFMPPRHGKSELVSRLFPAYYMYRFPERWVGLASYGAELAYALSGDVHDNYYRGMGYITAPRGAVKHWRSKTRQGGLWAAGIDGPMTGKGFHLGIIDDPVKNSAEAKSEVKRASAISWYQSTYYSRQEPNAAIVLIQCMVGGTPVLMADGREKPLGDVRIGDTIATYEAGRLSTSVVMNWANNGPDCVFTIRMKSGTIVTANERHPFLVQRGEVTEWVKLKNLKAGDSILRATGAGGEASPAHSMGATSLPSVRATARPTTTSRDGRRDTGHRLSTRNPVALLTYGTDTGSTSKATACSSRNRADGVLSVGNRPEPMSALIGVASSASITTTRRGRCEDCSATIATSSSGTERHKASFSGPLGIYEIAPDEIVEIAPAGCEDVFDIQVDRTENFIANGLVSHNTRWHERDLAGWLLDQEGSDDGQHERWHIASFEARKEPDPPPAPQPMAA